MTKIGKCDILIWLQGMVIKKNESDDKDGKVFGIHTAWPIPA